LALNAAAAAAQAAAALRRTVTDERMPYTSVAKELVSQAVLVCISANEPPAHAAADLTKFLADPATVDLGTRRASSMRARRPAAA